MAIDAKMVDEQSATAFEDGDQLLSLEHVAKIMDVSVPQVRRFCKYQGLSIVRLGSKLIRVRRCDMRAFIETHHGPWDKAS